MYRVKTYIDRSPVHGIGVFAGEDIPKGTLVWSFEPGFDLCYTQAEYEAMSKPVRDYFDIYAYWNKGRIWFCGDHGRYANHSDDPNVANWPEPDSDAEAATRDIKKGEEILSDYRTFDDPSRENLAQIIGS